MSPAGRMSLVWRRQLLQEDLDLQRRPHACPDTSAGHGRNRGAGSAPARDRTLAGPRTPPDRSCLPRNSIATRLALLDLLAVKARRPSVGRAHERDDRVADADELLRDRAGKVVLVLTQPGHLLRVAQSTRASRGRGPRARRLRGAAGEQGDVCPATSASLMSISARRLMTSSPGFVFLYWTHLEPVLPELHQRLSDLLKRRARREDRSVRRTLSTQPKNLGAVLLRHAEHVTERLDRHRGGATSRTKSNVPLATAASTTVDCVCAKTAPPAEPVRSDGNALPTIARRSRWMSPSCTRKPGGARPGQAARTSRSAAG